MRDCQIMIKTDSRNARQNCCADCIFENFGLIVNRIIRTNYGDYSIDKMKLGEFKKVNPKK